MLSLNTFINKLKCYKCLNDSYQIMFLNIFIFEFEITFF